MPHRITIHWTGGAHFPNSVDLRAYHFCIDRTGSVYDGLFLPEDNDSIDVTGEYAKHAGGFNSGNIGVAMCGMAGTTPEGAKRGEYGLYPLTLAQYESCVKMCASLCTKYDISVHEVKVHSELSPERKWDVNVIPNETHGGYKYVAPTTASSYFRNRIREVMGVVPPQKKEAPEVVPQEPTGWSSNYYQLPEDAKELDDIIVYKDMHWHIANIFKACYRFGEKSGTSELYDINKIIWFAEQHKALLEKEETEAVQVARVLSESEEAAVEEFTRHLNKANFWIKDEEEFGR